MNQDDAFNMLQKINEMDGLVQKLALENKLLKQKIQEWEKLCIVQHELLSTSKELHYILNKETI